MQGEEIVALGAITTFLGAVVAIFSVHVTRRNAERMKRLEVMQQALSQPTVDEHTKKELLRLLAEDHQRARLATAETLARLRTIGRAVLVGAGWLMFAGGGAMLLLAESGMMRGMPSEPGWTLLILGFLAMSLPVAIRELVTRSAPAPANQ